jgi:hypothetical protein
MVREPALTVALILTEDELAVPLGGVIVPVAVPALVPE